MDRRHVRGQRHLTATQDCSMMAHEWWGHPGDWGRSRSPPRDRRTAAKRGPLPSSPASVPQHRAASRLWAWFAASLFPTGCGATFPCESLSWKTAEPQRTEAEADGPAGPSQQKQGQRDHSAILGMWGPGFLLGILRSGGNPSAPSDGRAAWAESGPDCRLP